MSGIPLTTLLPGFGKTTLDTARRWVKATLAQAQALAAYDCWLYPRDPARQADAQRLHDAWKGWVEDAEAVVRNGQSLSAAVDTDLDLEPLLDEICSRKAMLKMTPALIARRREQVERGEVYSAEEVRRELRSGSGG